MEKTEIRLTGVHAVGGAKVHVTGNINVGANIRTNEKVREKLTEYGANEADIAFVEFAVQQEKGWGPKVKAAINAATSIASEAAKIALSTDMLAILGLPHS